MASVDEIADRLYGLPPEQFIEARDKAAKAEKLPDVRKLRRPTLAAWAINLLVRQEPEVVEEFLALGEGLRSAQQALAGDELRRLASQRQQLVSGLVTQARRLAASAEHPLNSAAQAEVESTLQAGLADPEAAEEIRSGRLVKPREYVGMGATGLRLVPAPEGDRPAKAGAAPPAPSKIDRELIRRRAAAKRELDNAEADAERASQERSAADAAVTESAARVADLERRLAEERVASREAAAAAREAAKAEQTALRALDKARRDLERLE
jgi:hypothetical protein